MTARLAIQPPQHLACAMMTVCALLLGTGASCERRAESAPEATAESASETTGERTSEPLGSADGAPRTDDEPSPAQKTAATDSTAGQAIAETAAIVRRPYVIAAVGDSLTDRRSGGGGYLDVVAAACPKTRIDNFGKGGDMVNQMRRRFERDVLPLAAQRPYTHLVLYGGVNDLYSNLTAGRTNDRIQDDLSAIYRLARERNMTVVAITVSPWGGFTRYFTPQRAESTRQLNHWILEQRAAGVIDHVVDSYPLLSCGDPERLCPEFAQRDGLHLASKGQQILGQALLETVFADCE